MKLQFHRTDLQLAHPWSTTRGRSDSAHVVVVELSEGSLTGLGEASPISRYGESIATVEAFLAKVDESQLSIGDIAASMAYLDSIAPGNLAAKCAIDVALVDAAAKRAGKPVYDYYALGFREHKHVTSFTIGIATPDEVRQKVAVAEQYPVLKLKVGVPGDAVMLATVREVAPEKWLRLDANEGWKTKEEALHAIESLARDARIELIEQPMPAATPAADWIWLKERSPIALFADESYHRAEDATRCADCFHGVNVKLAKAGGLSGAFEALQAARRLGLRTMLGCMIETSLLISAAAHLAELCDYLDLDGNLLITNDPHTGVTSENGVLSFANAGDLTGLRVRARVSPYGFA